MKDYLAMRRLCSLLWCLIQGLESFLKDMVFRLGGDFWTVLLFFGVTARFGGNKDAQTWTI